MAELVEKLYLDGGKLRANAIVEKINKEENASPRELYIRRASKVIPAIADVLPNFSNLETLSMSGHVHINDAHTVANFIAKSTLLKLELLNCVIKNDAFVVILDSVRISGLQTLNFRRASFSKSDSEAIAKCIASLTKLSFTACKFDNHGLISIMDAIKLSTLGTLILIMKGLLWFLIALQNQN